MEPDQPQKLEEETKTQDGEKLQPINFEKDDQLQGDEEEEQEDEQENDEEDS